MPHSRPSQTTVLVATLLFGLAAPVIAEQVRVDWSVDTFTNGGTGLLSGTLGVYEVVTGNELVEVDTGQVTFMGSGFTASALNTSISPSTGTVSIQFSSLTSATLAPTSPNTSSQLNFFTGGVSGLLGAFSNGFKPATICETSLCNALDPNDPNTFTGTVVLTAEVVPVPPTVPALSTPIRGVLVSAWILLVLAAGLLRSARGAQASP